MKKKVVYIAYFFSKPFKVVEEDGGSYTDQKSIVVKFDSEKALFEFAYSLATARAVLFSSIKEEANLDFRGIRFTGTQVFDVPGKNLVNIEYNFDFKPGRKVSVMDPSKFDYRIEGSI